MIKKDDKTTKDFVTYLMQTLDMKLRYWFFDHPEGREEFIECLEVFQKIIELAIQYRVE